MLRADYEEDKAEAAASSGFIEAHASDDEVGEESPPAGDESDRHSSQWLNAVHGFSLGKMVGEVAAVAVAVFGMPPCPPQAHSPKHSSLRIFPETFNVYVTPTYEKIRGNER
jgi:hypothetical protein